MLNALLNLETYATTTDSAIAQISVVYFDVKTKQIFKTFLANINPESEMKNGYYIDLDEMISKADELIASSDYKQYVNVETFENILNQAKAIDRNLGSSSQFIIDDLCKQLLDAYNSLEKQTVTPELPKEDKVTKQTELSNSSSVATGDTSNVLMLMLLMLISYSGFKFVNK